VKRRIAEQTVAVNLVGRHLFPLVTSAEEPINGSRLIPRSTGLRADRYELTGVVDVLSHVKVNECPVGNRFRQALHQACPDLPSEYEVVVDYKGAHRPNDDSPYWKQGEWQVHTYAWLRNRRDPPIKVAAGILLYVNELSPGTDDIVNLKKGIKTKTTDELPTLPEDRARLERWRPGNDTEHLLSMEYRWRRAIRVVPATPKAIDLRHRRVRSRRKRDRVFDQRGGQGWKYWSRLAANLCRFIDLRGM